MDFAYRPDIYDDHTLYVRCGNATSKQVEDAFHQALKMQPNYKTDIIVQIVENRDCLPLGYAFVYISNPEVYYMFLGKNPDGSDRIKYVDCVSNTKKENCEKEIVSKDWADIAEPISIAEKSWSEYGVYHDKESSSKCTKAQKIKVTDDPLLQLPVIHFDNQKIVMSVDRAKANNIDEQRHMPNILKCKNLPNWVTKSMLKEKFSPFASKNKKSEANYPIVNIDDSRNGRNAFITFDPKTHDAYFALHMTKKTTFVHEYFLAGVSKTEKVVLMFGHSFRTDRDRYPSESRSSESGCIHPIKQKKDKDNCNTTIDNKNIFSILEDCGT